MLAGGDRKLTDSANRRQHPGLTLTTMDSRKWRRDGQLSDTDSQDGRPVSDFSERVSVEQPVTPVVPAAIPMEARLAITKALKLSSTGNRTEI